MRGPFAIDVSAMAAVDGVFPGTRIDDVFPAALGFFAPRPLTLIPADRAVQVMHRHRDEAVHSMVARCTHHGRELIVLDFGASAYIARTRALGDCQPGSLYRGDIRLTFAPLTGFDAYVSRAGAPPLVYDWRVENISAPDPSDGEWRDLSQIPHKHDPTQPIIFHCTALSDAPRHTLDP